MTNSANPQNAGQLSGQILSDYRASGKTQAEYCREAGISISKLGYHQRRVRELEQARLVPVKVTPPPSAGAFESYGTMSILLRNGRRVDMGWRGNASGLSELLSSLERE